MVKRQMELSLGHGPESGQPSSRASVASNTQQRRQTRAHWWFARMRQVVEGTLERQADSRAAS